MNCFLSTKRTTFQRTQVHIYVVTQLPLQVNSMCWKCIGKVMEKSRWRIFMSHWAHPPLPRFLISFEEVLKERGSRGSRRWFLFEADSWELLKWPLPFSAWRCALSSSPLALWLDGEETVRERAEAGPLWWPRSSIMKQFCSHLRYHEVTLFLKTFCKSPIPLFPVVTLQTVNIGDPLAPNLIVRELRCYITLMLMCFPPSFHVGPKTSPASLMTLKGGCKMLKGAQHWAWQ